MIVPKKTMLGSSPLEVSRIALGCWQFAGGEMWGERSEEKSIQTVHAALDMGINFFDTAPGYGNGESERILGLALEGRREEAKIATKVSTHVKTRNEFIDSVDRSLEFLKTDRIDLLQMHWPNRELTAQVVVDIVEQLQSEGKVCHFGVCNYGPADLKEMLAAGGKIISNQLPYSLLARSIEFEIEPICQANGIAILPYSPLQQGLLTGKMKTPADVPDSRARTRHFKPTRPQSRHNGPGCEEETFAAINQISKIAEAVGISMTRLSLAWLNAQPAVGSIIAGASNPEQLKENYAALSLDLSPGIIQELKEATQIVKTRLGKNPDLWSSESRYR